MNNRLINEICKRFDELDIKNGVREKAMPLLENLADYHLPTLEHSFRVAEYGTQIAGLTYAMEKKYIWFPGIMHDVGKIEIPLELLTKINNWNEKDKEIMEKHVERGCSMLVKLSEFIALAVFYSHYFKRDGGYPTDKDFEIIFGDTYDKWHEQEKFKAISCGRIINLADEYDAAKTRKNDKFSPGVSRLLSTEEARKILLKNNHDQIPLIKRLYEIGIFN
jgi:hypothetical protein